MALDMGENSREQVVENLFQAEPFNKYPSLKSNEEHPKNATVVYPKYKTAIYVVGCEYQGDSIEGLCEQRYWQRHSDQMFTRAKQCCNEALNMGWNAIFVKNSELSEIRQDQTLPWIVDCLKESEKNEMQGGLIYCG